MTNDNIQATWDYHDGTKHPNGRLFDWFQPYDNSMRPLLFKIYPDLTPTLLPLDRTPRGLPALQAIAVNDAEPAPGQNVDLDTLTRIFYFSAGITKHLTYRPTGRTIPFRAAACTGALYHIEIYLVCGDIPGLDAGVYHLDPQGPSIRQLRQGDYRQIVVEASGHEPAVAVAPAILVATSVFGRNAIKYQSRAYRHAFWDCGTILANTLAIGAAHQLSVKIVAGFVDATISRLLDLDPLHELPLALVPIGAESDPNIPPAPPVSPLNLAVQPFSDHRIHFPAIPAMHVASSLPDPDAVTTWRGVTPQGQSLPPSGPLTPLQPLSGDAFPADPVEQVIERRGSTRQFTRESISFAQLSTLLRQSLQGIPADFIEPPGATLSDVYLTVHAVDGLAPGAYLLRREEWALELLKAGDFRETSGFLGLEQDLPADASANIFFLAELPPILERFGNRGYRAAQFNASIAAGRIYLAAYAQRFGATGLTFYDDPVTEFFSPHAEGKSVMFLIALGHKTRLTISS
jgi:SagB-type dehydrogenase family enzyme